VIDKMSNRELNQLRVESLFSFNESLFSFKKFKKKMLFIVMFISY